MEGRRKWGQIIINIIIIIMIAAGAGDNCRPPGPCPDLLTIILLPAAMADYY